jgi:UBX domain/UBA-like domain
MAETQTMSDPELLDQFVAITSAPRHVAEHILEAHGWNLEPSVNFYLESGGVGHGNETARFGFSDPVPMESPLAPPRRPLPASAAPRSSPLETFPGGAYAGTSSLEEEDQEQEQDLTEDQALAASARAAGAQPRPRDYFQDQDWTPAEDSDMFIEGSSEEEVDDDEEGLEEEEGVRRRRKATTRRNRIRRNRPGGAALDDPELRQLDRLMRQAAAARGGNNGNGDNTNISNDVQIVEEDEPLPNLPDDVDLEEQKMLLAAMTGEVYRGRIPDFAIDPRYRPVQLSPGAQARQNLRQEQDAAYYESLELDKLKAEEQERIKREEREAMQAAQKDSERIEKEAKEAAAALQLTLAAKEASLPKEPPLGDPDAVQIVVRLPGGGRLQRRFRSSHLLSSIFDFVDITTSKESSSSQLLPGSYSLVSQFPRRVFEDGGVDTLAEVDLAHKQEAFFVEIRD